MNAHLFKTERDVKILYVTEDGKDVKTPKNTNSHKSDSDTPKNLAAEQLFEVDKDLLFRNLLRPDKYELVETFTLKNDAKELEKQLKILKPDILLSDTTLNLDECRYIIKRNNESMGIIDIEGFSSFLYLGISKSELNKYFSLFYFIDQIKSIKHTLDFK